MVSRLLSYSSKSWTAREVNADSQYDQLTESRCFKIRAPFYWIYLQKHFQAENAGEGARVDMEGEWEREDGR